MYPGSWHKLYGDKTGYSAKSILPTIVELFEARSTLEIGCGNGHWTQVAIDAGVKDYFAVDGPWTDPKKLLFDPSHFRVANLEEGLSVNRRYDLAICLEVAEHVSAASSKTLVQSLASASDIVLFGAAVKYQGGHGHINEQRQSYWRDLFQQAGYQPFDLVRPRVWNNTGVHYWYRQNAFVYISDKNASALARAKKDEREICDSKIFFDAIHPEKYELMASYEAIALKRLLRALPSWLAVKVGEKFKRT